MGITSVNLGYFITDLIFKERGISAARGCHQQRCQRGLVQGIVDVAEGGLPQVRAQCGEHGIRHGRLIDVGRAAHEELDEGRQSFRHGRRTIDF